MKYKTSFFNTKYVVVYASVLFKLSSNFDFLLCAQTCCAFWNLPPFSLNELQTTQPRLVANCHKIFTRRVSWQWKQSITLFKHGIIDAPFIHFALSSHWTIPYGNSTCFTQFCGWYVYNKCSGLHHWNVRELFSALFQSVVLAIPRYLKLNNEQLTWTSIWQPVPVLFHIYVRFYIIWGQLLGG